jgi:hypothetical protein
MAEYLKYCKDPATSSNVLGVISNQKHIKDLIGVFSNYEYIGTLLGRGKYYVHFCAISGYRREVYVICAFLGCYAAFSINSLATFRNNLSVPSSWVKNLGFLILEVGTMRNFPQQGKSHLHILF